MLVWVLLAIYVLAGMSRLCFAFAPSGGLSVASPDGAPFDLANLAALGPEGFAKGKHKAEDWAWLAVQAKPSRPIRSWMPPGRTTADGPRWTSAHSLWGLLQSRRSAWPGRLRLID